MKFALVCLCTVVLYSGGARAQSDSPKPSDGLWQDQKGSGGGGKREQPIEPLSTPSPDVSGPVGTLPQVGVSPPEAEPFDALPSVRVYGFVKPSAIYAFRGMETLSRPNMSGITAAGNPVVGFVADQSRFTMQFAQSRFGFAINENGHFRGLIEADFWDPARPTPALNAVPRLRIARVTWAPSKSFAIELGQDYDLHAPLNPHTYNFVGGLYQAGNTGFRRQQLKVLIRPPHFDLGFAIGFQGANGGEDGRASDGPLELSRFPTFAARIAIVDDDLMLGVSGIFTQLVFNKGEPATRQAASMAGALYFTITPSPDIDIRVEGYLGRNNSNMGLLALGFGRGATLNPNGTVAVLPADIDEYGGFVSARGSLGRHHAVYAIAGMASVINRGDLLPSYTRDGAGDVVLTSTTTGPGIKHNVAVRIGYELRPVRYLAYVIEGMAYDTLHTLRAEDRVAFDPHVRAFGVESGFLLQF